MSLRARLGLAAAAAVALAVLGVAVAAYAGTRSELRGQVDSSLQGLARTVLTRASAPPGQGGPGGPGGRAEGRGRPGAITLPRRPAREPGPRLGGRSGPPAAGVRGDRDEGLGLEQLPGQAFGGASGTLTLIYPSGGTYVPAGQRYSIPVTQQAKRIAASGTGRLFADMRVGGHHIRVVTEGLGPRGAIAVALPLAQVDHALSSQLLLLVLIAAGGICLAALLGLVVARTALAPIARFTSRTETIAANPDTPGQRLQVQGGDELARLAQTFNSTLDKLERSLEAQRNLVADASHELRTPISTLRANLQLLRDEGFLSQADRSALREDMIEELDELTALVSDVVELARGTKPNPTTTELRLDSIVESALERSRRRHPQVTIEARLEPTLIEGEGERIARAVANLLDNACKWSPTGGVIEVSLQGGTLSVRDHGPGFREDDLPFVFDRFYRARDARSKPGSGLGLAIVKQAAEAHGGWVKAANASNGGAIVQVAFGLARPNGHARAEREGEPVLRYSYVSRRSL